MTMSEDNGDELNFNELVGNLLSSHNATENHVSSDVENEDTDLQSGFANEHQEKQEHLAEDLPEFGGEVEDDDLAAVVASAIQGMDHVEPVQPDVEDVVPQSDNSEIEQKDSDAQEDRHWANMLQQGLMQGTDQAKPQADDQLDQDDETLRRAILESLGELGSMDRGIRNEEEEVKERSKKSSKKKKKKKGKDHTKEKHVSAKKKKHHKKEKEAESQGDDLLDFEDVIKGFMRQGNEASAETSPQPEAVGDEETQALVEATLRAFERELLGSQPGATSQAHESHAKSKQTEAKTTPITQKHSRPPITGIDIASQDEVPSTASKKKKKKKKKKQQISSEKEKDDLEEDDFSKALAAMVNEVVNTSLTDSTPGEPPEAPSPVAAEPAVGQSIEDEHSGREEESFDLNQIMQKAMSMAFQDQNQESFDNSAMEEFNRGLGELSVSDLLSGSSSERKKPFTSKTSSTGTTPKVPKVSRKKSGAKTEAELSKRKSSTKPSLSPEEALRKRYVQAVMAAAAAARKRIVARNKALRLEQRVERKKAREEKRLQKKCAKEQQELERKELEEIVAKGPPYPPDLRLTKSGKPKKPYRRWTQEEMEKRASMPPEELGRPGKVKKDKKKKSKKLKRVPLSTLKKIPLFNFGKESSPADVKVKLNGIDETLKRIPLQSYQLDIAKLAPPNTVPPGEWEKEKKIEEEDELTERSRNEPFVFEAGRKTVVRREKIPFHPPWTLPSQVPFALPVARRKRKEKSKGSSSLIGNRHKGSSRGEKVPSSVRSRIIPAVLLPIVNTLKAAARAKAASGASTEEANRHLVTIIRHTKKSIAETLNLARKRSTRDYSVAKSEGPFHHSSEISKRRTTRFPIFSLSKIKQIDTSDDSTSKSTKALSVEPSTPVVKIEDTEISEVLQPQTKNSLAPPEVHNKTNEKRAISSDGPQAPKEMHGSLGTALVTDCRQKTVVENSPEQRESVKASTPEEASTREQGQSAEGISSPTAHQMPPIEENVGEPVIDLDQKENQPPATKDTAAVRTTTEVELLTPRKVQKPPGNDKQIETLKLEVSEGNSLSKESFDSLKEVVDKSNIKEEQKIHEVLDDLVKEHFTQSQGEPVELTDNVRYILSATIEELIPVIDGQQRDNGERPKRQRKGPPPVLNLDGLVPPNSLRMIPKIERPPVSSVTQKLATKVRKPRKKADQPVPLYTFSVPDFKNMQGRRTMLLKRAKEHLSNEEMGILKREINKERKRKWREANVEKNWENDLRARLKKRANAKFGEQESIEKGKWYQDELNRSLAEREIKQEGQDATCDKKIVGSTNLSDNEVLNMIATTLNKLDVARLLERELKEEATGYGDQKPGRRTDSSTTGEDHKEVSGSHAVSQPTLQITIPSYDEQMTYDGQEPHNDDTEVLNESENSKRPYPDDIPVTIPLMKRPKCVNAQEDN